MLKGATAWLQAKVTDNGAVEDNDDWKVSCDMMMVMVMVMVMVVVMVMVMMVMMVIMMMKKHIRALFVTVTFHLKLRFAFGDESQMGRPAGCGQCQC